MAVVVGGGWVVGGGRVVGGGSCGGNDLIVVVVGIWFWLGVCRV